MNLCLKFFFDYQPYKFGLYQPFPIRELHQLPDLDFGEKRTRVEYRSAQRYSCSTKFWALGYRTFRLLLLWTGEVLVWGIL